MDKLSLKLGAHVGAINYEVVKTSRKYLFKFKQNFHGDFSYFPLSVNVAPHFEEPMPLLKIARHDNFRSY
ncbi:MAG: hypothetical protein NTY32_00565, partial [Bacteroidia bacterium]|nr:hypothetical protein [Bacteroidia bacterium]